MKLLCMVFVSFSVKVHSFHHRNISVFECRVCSRPHWVRHITVAHVLYYLPKIQNILKHSWVLYHGMGPVEVCCSGFCCSSDWSASSPAHSVKRNENRQLENKMFMQTCSFFKNPTDSHGVKGLLIQWTSGSKFNRC